MNRIIIRIYVYLPTLTWIHNRFVTYFMGMLLPVQGIVIKYGTHDSHHGRVLNMYMCVCTRRHIHTQNCNLLQLSKYGRILYPLDSRTKNKNERAKFPAGMCLTSKHWSLLLKCAKSSSLFTRISGILSFWRFICVQSDLRKR